MGNKKTVLEEVVDHVVTQDTLDLNPELVEQGIKVGDTIQYPANPEAAQISNEIIEELKLENESLKAQLADQDDEIEKLHIEIREAKEVAQEALQTYNAAAVQVLNQFEAEVNGNKVKVNFGVYHNGAYHTPADLVDNPDVVAHLIRIGSGSITILED
jgi:predicted RNase H-like nuclease (RuvC/YqgF family)